MAENGKRDIIIDIQAKGADESLQQMAKLRAEQDRLKEEVKKYKKELQDLMAAEKEQGKLTDEQAKREKELREMVELSSTEIKNYNSYIADHQKVVAKSIDEANRQSGSLRQMRADVGALTVEWENLSKEQREGARGQEIQKSLAELNEQINAASLSTKNFKDNIGNYSSALDGMIDQNTLAGKAFSALGVSSDMTAKTLKTNVVGGLKAVGAAMKALLANPLFAVIAGITAILMTILGAVKKNQAAMDAMNRAMAPVGKLLDIIFDLLGKVAERLAGFIEGFMKFIGVADSSATRAVTLGQEIEKLENEMIISRQKRHNQIAQMEEELLKKEKYTHEQRLEIAENIRKLREEEAAEERKLLDMKIKQFDLEEEGTDTSRERMAERNRLVAERLALDQKVIESTKKHTSTIDRLNKALADEAAAEKAAQQARIEAHRERIRIQKELEKATLEELEDLLIASIKDSRERELKELEVTHQRKIEALQKRLAEDENLTLQARKNLNAQLELLDQAYFDKLNEIKARHAEEDKYIELEKQREIDAAEAEQRLIANELKLEQRREELDNELLLTLEYAQIEHEELLNLSEEAKAELFASEEAYQLAVIKSKNKLKAAEKSYQDAIRETANAQIIAVGAMAGAVGNLLGEMAGQSEAMTGFSKALALVDIATNSAVGVSKAIASGAGMPFPANLVAIAAGVGSVLAGISRAYSLLKSDKPQKPKELGNKTVSMPSIPASKPSPSMPSLAPQVESPAQIRELGTIEARDEINRNNVQQFTAEVSVVEINEVNEGLRVKEQFARI